MKQTTFSTKPKDIKHNWQVVDLKNQPLGRAAVKIATLLLGKNKPYYVTHLDCGDYVVAINASDIKLTGRKAMHKTYFRHSGYPGGARMTKVAEVLAKNPAKVIETAVLGMLPKNKLRQPRLKRLKIFAGSDHKYQDKFAKQS